MMNLPPVGLEHLSTAVILLDEAGCVASLNPAAESLFGVSGRNLQGQPILQMFTHAGQLAHAMEQAAVNHAPYIEHELTLVQHERRWQLRVAVTPLPGDPAQLLLEFHTIDRTLKLAREEQMQGQTQAGRELLRNLAHEIKNPLGGIRGAAQLLEQELDKPALKEYTRVVIDEADRLRSLADKLLTSRQPRFQQLNIHEVLERVRSLLLAENPAGLEIRRDYDTSLPLLDGDKELLIQAVLNVMRNAVQAMDGEGRIVLRTRIARQVTLMKKRHRLALRIEIEDNGPGIPPQLRDSVFYPLVSGRADGNGLGLTLAQDFVSQHHGSIEFESEPGRTCFIITLPVGEKNDS